MTISIKPCAFCGNDGQTDYRMGLGYIVECVQRFDNCPMNARTKHHTCETNAIKAWNTRALEDSND